MREHFRRRTVKLCQRDVPDIPDVFKTLRRSIKATGSEIPEFGEKAGSALEFRLRFGGVANVVANDSLLPPSVRRIFFEIVFWIPGRAKPVRRGFVFDPPTGVRYIDKTTGELRHAKARVVILAASGRRLKI